MRTSDAKRPLRWSHVKRATLVNAAQYSGVPIKTAVIDRGYKGAKEEEITILRSGQRRGITKRLKALIKRRSCIEGTIGHMKTEGRLDQYAINLVKPKNRAVIVLMDTTYWGRNFGLMLFKDAITKENLLKYFVRYETNILYIQGIEHLKSEGFTILAIVCDGRKGLVQSFGNIPVQMCQFHQSAIIRRYLTRNPKLKAAQNLMDVVDIMKQTDKESFVGALELWFRQWASFLNERTVNALTCKSFYTHKKLRSAYRSLKNNLPWLFTWYDYYELNIPNTTNAIDGHFADLKNKLRNHNGLSTDRKMKFIEAFFKGIRIPKIQTKKRFKKRSNRRILCLAPHNTASPLHQINYRHVASKVSPQLSVRGLLHTLF